MIPLLEVWEQAVQLLDWVSPDLADMHRTKALLPNNDCGETNRTTSIFIENKIENKRSDIKGSQRAVADTRFARTSQ
jgi:hypothetical protein